MYFNRFRYYDPGAGQYVSQDPIGLQGGDPTLYGYVGDTSTYVDPFGLADYYHATGSPSHTTSIMKGIDPSAGRPDLDFNPAGRGGFYVTNDLQQAKQWASMHGRSGDVIHFDIPDSELDKLHIKKFDGATRGGPIP